jgi:hypothetical protein
MATAVWQTRRADELDDSRYALLTDLGDVRRLLSDIYPARTARELEPTITGALVAAEDGDYTEVWLTECGQPYTIYAEYCRVR